MFASDRIISVGDVAIYTVEEDIPVWQVLKSVGEREQSAECSLSIKKCTAEELHDYFKAVLPSYDPERVHDSDMKKLLSWYNILIKAGYKDFEALLAEGE